MKVYKDDRGSHDLEVQIEKLQLRVRELEEINEAHKKLNGELREERIRKHEVTYEGHVAELARLREAALKKGSFSSAVNAEANRGKAAGLYIDRKIIKTGKLEDMSEQELEAKMKQILDDYAQIIDVTPSKSSESSLPKPEES